MIFAKLRVRAPHTTVLSRNWTLLICHIGLATILGSGCADRSTSASSTDSEVSTNECCFDQFIITDADPMSMDGSSLGDGGLDEGTVDVVANDMLVSSQPDAQTDSSHVSPCQSLVCDPGYVCRASQSRCVPRNFGQSGGPCENDGDCTEGECRQFDNGLTLCFVPCTQGTQCSDSVCSPSIYGSACFARCTDVLRCGSDTVCHPLDGFDGLSACLPDCRRFGCKGQLRCDEQTGRCMPSDFPCRYDCELGESCIEGRCLASSGQCRTSYHCPNNRYCHDGHCIMIDGVECQRDSECDEGHRCVLTEDGVGVCRYVCNQTQDCPPSLICSATSQTCRLNTCEFGAGLNRTCESSFRGLADTCVPFEGDPPPGYSADGYCVPSGQAPVGAECDAQATPQESLNAEHICTAGAICWGDNDALGPELGPGRGACRLLCSEDMSDCGQLACVRIGDRDDLSTPTNEDFPFSICLPADCVVGENCSPESTCQPHSFWSPHGVCRADGAGGPGERCETDDDCRGFSMCVSRPGGAECMALCGSEVASCPGVQRCYQEPTWAFGVCVP